MLIVLCVFQAAVRDYYVRPLLDYSSVQQVKGPLVILDNVKVCIRVRAVCLLSQFIIH